MTPNMSASCNAFIQSRGAHVTLFFGDNASVLAVIQRVGKDSNRARASRGKANRRR